MISNKPIVQSSFSTEKLEVDLIFFDTALALLKMAQETSKHRPIFTIGHSTHPVAEFIEILQAHKVELLVDVRTIPRSRHNPQYNLDSLPKSLKEVHIDHCWMESLGGLRKTHKDSPNTGWRNASFRGYADYMQTPEFAAAIDELLERTKSRQAAIMCAEAVPWRCHRSLVGDALLVRGVEVEDIMSATVRNPHKLTRFAHVEGQLITYPSYEEMSG